MLRTRISFVLVLSLLAALGAVSVAAAAAPTDSSALRKSVSSAAIVKHEQEFQRIANRNGGTREASTPGYAASAKYVADKLRGAGYTVAYQPFEYPYFEEGTSSFERLTPTARTYVHDTDYALMEYSGDGDVTGQVVPTNDVVIPPGDQEGTSNSGCEASDFPAKTAGNVALIQRGTCDFVVKVENAEAAGAVAAIIFNEGQPGRTEIIEGTLGHPVDIPALDTTFAVGEELYNLASAGTASVRIAAQTVSETRTSKNVIADYPAGGRTDRTVVVGAHLDSVAEGPGINDNGSGTAGILEIALQMRKLNIKPTNHVRFAFWGAEEAGLHGSTYYVNNLTARQQKDIAVNLNFDMIGSPNFVRFVYDGDGDALGTSGPSGSGTVEDIFVEYFASQGLQTEPTEFDGRSDYEAFINVGIPAGGLFTGAEDIKTAEEASIYGGTAGVAHDPCYHAACDDIKNINTTALDQMADGAAHATLAFAQTGSAVSGTDQASNTAASKMEYKGPNAKK